MATSDNLKALNAYPQFKTRRGLTQVINYRLSVQNRDERPKIPRRLTTEQKSDWIDRFDHSFVAEDGKLFYRPPRLNGRISRLNLEIVPPNDQQEKLTELYNDIKFGLGGINNFYYNVCSKYLGITRQTTTAFLKKQTAYQLTRPIRHHINRQITVKCPNERWILDVVFMEKYGFDYSKETKFSIHTHNIHYPPNAENEKEAGTNSYRYILTAIDVFSSRVFAEPLMHHTANDIVIAFKRMCRFNRTHPRIVQTDNGSEFEGNFKAYINDYNARHPHGKMSHLFASSHTPTSNGKIERANKTIRLKLAEVMVRNNNLEWVTHLQNVIQNINQSRISGSKFTPDDLWSEGYHPPEDHEPDFDIERPKDTDSGARIRKYHQTKMIEKAVKKVQKGEEFRANDLVRINHEALFPVVRMRAKNQMEKKYTIVNYSPQLYRIVRKIEGNVPAEARDLGVRAYDIKDNLYWVRSYPDNEPLNRHFSASELMKVGTIHSLPTPLQNGDLDFNRAGQLNKFIPYQE